MTIYYLQPVDGSYMFLLLQWKQTVLQNRETQTPAAGDILHPGGREHYAACKTLLTHFYSTSLEIEYIW